MVASFASIAYDDYVLGVFIFADKTAVVFEFFDFYLFRIFFEPSGSIEISDLFLVRNFVCGREDIYG